MANFKQSKIYNKGKSSAFQALHNVNIKVNDDEFVAIIGKSDAGKTTRIHIPAYIDSHESRKYMIVDEYYD